MRKDEAHRRPLRIAIQQQFFVFHNEIIRVDVVGAALASFHLTVNHSLLLVFGKIPCVGVMRGDGVQIFYVLFISELELHIADNVVVLLLEHIGVNAVVGTPFTVIPPVFRHLVNEKQAQHLDALAEEPAFPLDVREDRLADLNAAELLLADFPDDVAGIDLDAVQELHRVVPSVDELDDKAVLILIQPAGIVIKVEPYADLRRLFADAGRPLEIKLDRSGGVGFGEVDPLEIDIAVRCRASRLRDAFYRDLLDKPLVVCLHRVQAINHVVDAVRSVRGGIAQSKQRMKFFQPLFCLRAFDRLWFINNEDRICFGNNIYGAAGAELVQLHINAPCVLALCIERLHVDDHHIDGTVGGKAVDLGQLRGIINKKADLLSVFLGKMLLRHLKGLVHSLPDRYARDNDDELAPSVMFVQLVHGLDVSVRLAHARFHLDSEVILARFRPFQPFGWLELVRPLHLLQIAQNDLIREPGNDRFIAPTGEVLLVRDGHLIVNAPVYHISRREIRLPREHIHHGFRRVRLEFLMFELKF